MPISTIGSAGLDQAANVTLCTTSGSVGIGTASPAQKLNVSGSGSVYGLITNTGTGPSNLFLGAGNAQTQVISRDATTGAVPTVFLQGTTESMRIDSSGNVGIGTSSPSGRLAVAATGGAGLIVGQSNENFYAANLHRFYDLSYANERMRIDSSGNLLVGTTSTTNGSRTRFAGNGEYVSWIQQTGDNTNNGLFLYLQGNRSSNTANTAITYGDDIGNRFRVLANGNVQNANNSYGSNSDAKLKENIVDATPKLEKLQQVRVVNYNLIGETQKQLGVVAQELEQIFPGMVEETPDRDAEGNDLGTTTKSVKYSVFVPMLIKALQEQQAIIVTMREELDALKAKVDA